MNLVDRLVRSGNGTLNPIRKTTMNPNAARITFMITPADRTSIRAGIDLLVKARGSSLWELGSRSSCPSIFLVTGRLPDATDRPRVGRSFELQGSARCHH